MKERTEVRGSRVCRELSKERMEGRGEHVCGEVYNSGVERVRWRLEGEGW
jgi:hypothetical protein